MIRAPFVIEGFFIGLFGAIIPLIAVCGAYNYLMKYILEHASFLKNIFTPVDLSIIAIPMCMISISVSCFICMLVSFFTIRKHLKI